MTRNEAFEAFLAAVNESVPETNDGLWVDRRAAIRDAALNYCRAAVREATKLERYTWGVQVDG